MHNDGGNIIQGNFIGTDRSKTLNLGNGAAGIYVDGASTTSLAGRRLVRATRSPTMLLWALRLIAGTGNEVRGNSIFSNGGIGIDLGSKGGVVANDAGDKDTGANNLQNYPVLTSLVYSGNATIIHGTLNSISNQSYQIDLYSNPHSDPSGYGQGQTYLGSVATTTDGTGNASFQTTLPVVLPANSFVSATATDAAGNTSEFSACGQFVPVNPVGLSVGVAW